MRDGGQGRGAPSGLETGHQEQRHDLSVRRLRHRARGAYGDSMPVLKFPRRLIRKLETPDLPLEALESIRRLRRYLDELEAACIVRARRLGASAADIGEALGITRQAVYNRLRALEHRPAIEPDSVIRDFEESEEIPDLETTPAARQ